MARHRGMQAPINSVKHIVQKTNQSIATGTILNVVVVDALSKNTARTSTFQVDEGSLVKAVYVECWIKSNSPAGTSAQQITTFEKIVSGQNTMTNSEALNLQAYENKKNIFYSSQGVLGDLTTNSIPVIRQWIAISKGKQRMGLSDRLVLNVAAVSEVQQCGLFIYKEYY